ncbi:GGDEF domain-containing protein [Geodermatophilus sp. SYSU D00815]
MRALPDTPGTGFLRHIRARDPQSAARSAAQILVLATVAIAAWTLLEHSVQTPLARAVSWAVVAVLALTAVVHRVVPPERLDRAAAGALMSVGGVLLGCCLGLLTHDTSAAAQSFLALPVIWAASHLKPAGAVLVTATTLVADAGTLLLLLPVGAALENLVFFGGVLILLATVLVRAGARQERLVAALESQARVDSLTGLVNRRVFEDALHTSARRRGSGTALLLIDVDSFKTINDRHGHPAGDEVLVHLARVLREQVRADDAVLSRLGGDELAVLLPGCSAEAAERRAEALLAAVRAAPVALPDGTRLPLSISLGVAHLPRHVDSLHTLYSAADAALYDAKRAGRGCVAVAAA